MSPLLHNMSAPPRTGVKAEKRGIADRIVVFSLAYALIVSGHLDAPGLPAKFSKKREFLDFVRDGSSDAVYAAIRARWPTPRDLLARIGHPKPLPITADFLIGWRVGTVPNSNSWYFSPDPQLAAGVQPAARGTSTSRVVNPICAGTGCSRHRSLSMNQA